MPPRSRIHPWNTVAFLTRACLICLAALTVHTLPSAAVAGEFTYQNPIAGGPRWIRDPFIIRAGDRYFMTGTYKEPAQDGPAAWPGFKLWASDDLLHWKDEGFVLRNEDIPWGDTRLWAPEIRFHPQRGKYYLTYNVRWNKTGRQGSGLAVADDVRGPYVNLTPDEPLAQSNDASLFFDDDGRTYLLQSSITICEVDLDQVKLIRPKKRLLVPAEEGAWDSRIIEGPNMVKVNGTYYLFWSATGWGYTVGYATALDVWGPYVKHPANPIYGAAKPEYENKLNEPPDCPFDEVGHGSLFKGPDGRWWLSAHGYGYEPGPFRDPRLCIDPLNFDPGTGQFSAKLTWRPQTIRMSAAQPAPGSGTKPRLIILADMGNEPDEEQQMIHMLVNCNEFDLEGLIAVTGKFLNERSRNEYKRVVHPELFHRLIDGYEKAHPNLCLHAPGYPSAESLHAIVAAGQRKYGIADVGAGKSTAGSELTVKALRRDDPRPLNVVVNAGSNTLAQALWDLRATHSDAELDALVARLRVFENGAQDNAGAWICREFPGVHWVRSNHQTYGYMGQGNGVGPYVWQPYPRDNQGQHRWAEQHIMHDHGALGALYPYRFKGSGFLEGGGTIPWLGLVNKGLFCVDQPSWGGWSGRFTATKQKNVWSRHADIRKDEETYGDFYAYAEVSDRWTDPESGIEYDSDFAPVWRWRRAMLNNCQARFDWCVMPYEKANHHPVAAFNGDTSDAIARITAKAGELVTLDASASSDPDEDSLRFRWYVYREPGTYDGSPIIDNETNPVTQIALPKDAAGKQIHVILQVNDENEIVSLYDYRRIVIDVEQPLVREGDWIVTGVETVRGERIRLNGNLILEPNAVLTLEDCHLEILGTRSREHLVDWRGGRLITRRSTLGGFVQEDGTPVHTVFHLYDGEWEALDTTVQYAYGISFHWKEGHGVLRGTRLKAGPRPDAIICSGQADITLIDSDFPIGLGVYVHKGGRTRLDLPAAVPITAVYDAETLTPGVEWRLDLKNTTVRHWFVFLRNIGMGNPPCEVTLGQSDHLIVSLLGHNLTGTLNLSNDLTEPVTLGNLTLRRAENPPGISMWALYFSGDETDLTVRGATHICELMHRGGRLHLSGMPSRNDLSIGCTTLELSGTAVMTLEHVHLGRPLTWTDDGAMGEANVMGDATLRGNDVSVRGVRFHTRDKGRVRITGLTKKGDVEIRQEGGEVELKNADESHL